MAILYINHYAQGGQMWRTMSAAAATQGSHYHQSGDQAKRTRTHRNSRLMSASVVDHPVFALDNP